jgi:hypothetical protein
MWALTIQQRYNALLISRRSDKSFEIKIEDLETL